MTTPATPVEPRQLESRVRHYRAMLEGTPYRIVHEAEAAGVPLLREALLEQVGEALVAVHVADAHGDDGGDPIPLIDFMDRDLFERVTTAVAAYSARAALAAAAPTVEPRCGYLLGHVNVVGHGSGPTPCGLPKGHTGHHAYPWQVAEPQRAAAGLDVERLAEAGRRAITTLESERPTDFANWLGYEGTMAAGLAGSLFGDYMAAEYDRLAAAAAAEESQP